MTPYITIRPRPEMPGTHSLVLVKDGVEMNLLATVLEANRKQAKAMRTDLTASGFRWCAKYCNGGLTRNLPELLHKLQEGSVKVVAKIEDDGHMFTFWGDVAGVSYQGFCFLIFDEKMAYEIMLATGIEPESVLKAFMSRRNFKVLPDIRENRIRYVTTRTKFDSYVVPPIFSKDVDGTFLSRSTRSRLIFSEEYLELRKQVLPMGQSI